MKIHRGDLEPSLSVTPTSNGTPVDLAGAVAVRVHLMREDLTVMDRAATVQGGAAVYAWAAGETDTIGVLDVEVEVTWGTATAPRPQTFPADEQVHIVPALA